MDQRVFVQADVVSDENRGGTQFQPDEHGRLRPVAFTSCNISATEQQYSQIEKECLATLSFMKKFDQWLYLRNDIEVHTDHQPLETTLGKPLNTEDDDETSTIQI